MICRQLIFDEKDNPDLLIGKGTAMNLMRMHQTIGQFLETPFFRVREKKWNLRYDGHLVNEKRIRRLMWPMGLMPIYQRLNTSKAAKGQDLALSVKGPAHRPPQSGLGSEITYVPMRRGFLYLGAIIGWYKRRQLAWRTSNTLEAGLHTIR